jgi:glutaredoxin
MSTMTTATKYICPHCDSADIVHHAHARWDWRTRAFHLVRVLDKGHCPYCDALFHYLQPTPIPDDVLAITDGLTISLTEESN